MRLTVASSAASVKLWNERSTPGTALEVAVKEKSLPYMERSTIAAAALTVPCAPGYDGSGAVAESGVQVGSATVSGLPSASAFLIAVTGRHRAYAYFAS